MNININRSSIWSARSIMRNNIRQCNEKWLSKLCTTSSGLFSFWDDFFGSRVDESTKWETEKKWSCTRESRDAVVGCRPQYHERIQAQGLLVKLLPRSKDERVKKRLFIFLFLPLLFPYSLKMEPDLRAEILGRRENTQRAVATWMSSICCFHHDNTTYLSYT